MPKKFTQEQLANTAKTLARAELSPFINIDVLNSLFEGCDLDDYYEGVIVSTDVQTLKSGNFGSQAAIEIDVEGRLYKFTFPASHIEAVQDAIANGLKNVAIHYHINGDGTFAKKAFDIELIDDSGVIRFVRVMSIAPVHGSKTSKYDHRGFRVVQHEGQL